VTKAHIDHDGANRGARPHTSRVFVPRTAPDERPARRALLQQISRLESELAGLFCSTWPRMDVLPALGPHGRRGPRLLDLAELEAVRDELYRSVDQSRRALSARTRIEDRNRRRIEEMLLEPERHRWVRVRNEDIGVPGCKSWHVRPRFGLLGMLLNWWRVRISSGCPLAT
jgi:hypothetical protein